MRTPRKSSFGNLTKYLIDEQGKLERLGDVLINNCHSTDPVWAALEVEATQEMNTRALSDKTYHLIVSFREGENPSAVVLKDVEQQMANALGYAEHQRIAVVHRDTDNVHMHIAINKIHPVSHTLHEPYRDHRTRDEVCSMLEDKHGLQKDNHKARKTPGQARAADMENMAGLQSLLSYTKELLPDIKQADSWEALHSVMQQNGLQIKPQGAGIVIVSESQDVGVKASSVDRALSKAALEAKLGPYQAPAQDAVKPQNNYSKKVVVKSEKAPSLYAKYIEERHTFSVARQKAWDQAKKQYANEVDLLKKTAALKRAGLRFASPGLMKQLAYKQISRDLQAGIKRAQEAQKKKRSEIYQTYTRPVWQDWLKKQAQIGNEAAASILRDRKAKSKYEANGIDSPNPEPKPGNIPGAPINNVTAKGAIVYKVANTPIRDDGKALKVSRWPTNNGLLASLHMARYRFGKELTITGAAQFKTAVARAAAQHKLDVTFTDPALEKLRQTFLTNPNAKDIYHDRSAQRGRDFSANVGSPGRAGAGGNSADNTATRRAASTTTEPGRLLHQPNIKRLGSEPPPQAQNRLRPMSECGLVFNQRGSEVLLPSHVPSVVGQQETKRDNSVRRDAPGARLSKEETAAAVDKYVNERNKSREKIFDISHHRRYTQFDTGIAIYSGIRQVDGQSMALLSKDNVMLVMPVDAKTAGRLSRLKVGTAVTINKAGNVTVKGRSR